MKALTSIVNCPAPQADGKWLLDEPLMPLGKPGGHGAIWKLMHDSGAFEWLAGQRRRGAIVRQISNPMAGKQRRNQLRRFESLSVVHAGAHLLCFMGLIYNR